MLLRRSGVLETPARFNAPRVLLHRTLQRFDPNHNLLSSHLGGQSLMSDGSDDRPFIICAREAMERAEACQDETERARHLQAAMQFLKMATEVSGRCP